ncbi:MAG TPA: LysM peptidoglycan-binding domain-containing protein [Deltaproteobacteria bacterium]|nr:LysM peptidoglycan-binding domain-containing protein [Deltaproteobacteria bacterium]
MIKQFSKMFFTVFISFFLLSLPVFAKEDTAQITLSKTAISKEHLYTYTVKKGDILSVIVRNVPGITEKDLADNYRLIQELNPDIEDVNKLRVGQKIILPGRPLTEPGVIRPKVPVADAKLLEKVTESTDAQPYHIKKGDTLIKIITRELRNVTDIKEMLSIIKSMNTNITDVNKIYAGDIIKLPSKSFFARTPKLIEEERIIEESIIDTPEIAEARAKISMPDEVRLAVVKQVITLMNASFTSTGNYYLPIPKTGQVTIDCSIMPVIEFFDNTVIFLDLEDRAPHNLKNIISENWSNYFLVKIDKKDDFISILRKVFSYSKNYNMIRQSRPLAIGDNLTAELFIDWVISATDSEKGQILRQGLRILYENDVLFPPAIKNFAQKNGLIITEISAQNGLVGKPAELYSLPVMPVYPTTSAKDFSYALLTGVGLNAQKDVDIKVFDKEKDGLNLSIRADVVVKNDNLTHIVYSRELSPQFVEVLTQEGNSLIFVGNADSPKVIMEKILNSMNIPFVSGYFTFSGVEKRQAPYSLSFSGTKIKAKNNDLYVTNFAVDEQLRGLLSEVWSASIVRY